MPWIHYRSELRRPVSLVLLGLAFLGWIVVARLAWVHSESGHDYRRQVRLLEIAEANARGEFAQLRQASGSLAEHQGKITAAQSYLTQLEQSRAEARARLGESEQSLEGRRREAAEAAKTTEATMQRLAGGKAKLHKAS